jgi:hypothetical protein
MGQEDGRESADAPVIATVQNRDGRRGRPFIFEGRRRAPSKVYLFPVRRREVE